jgi:SNF2 family DNA or RNA helicase
MRWFVPTQLVVDEAHRMKAPQLSAALQKVVTKRRLLLTGSPVQNKASELAFLVQFALGMSTTGWADVHSSHDYTIAEFCTKLHSMLGDGFLRRTADDNIKTFVQCDSNVRASCCCHRVTLCRLPRRRVFHITCFSTDLQFQLYRAFIDACTGQSFFAAASTSESILNHPMMLYLEWKRLTVCV